VTEAREIEPLWHYRFYDGPIDGVVLFRGQLCWFQWNEEMTPSPLSEDARPERVYEIFAMSDSELRNAVTEHIRFERYVGCNSCYHVTADGSRARDLKWYARFGRFPEDNPFYKGRPLGTVGVECRSKAKCRWVGSPTRFVAKDKPDS